MYYLQSRYYDPEVCRFITINKQQKTPYDFSYGVLYLINYAMKLVFPSLSRSIAISLLMTTSPSISRTLAQ